ncbi:SLAC1 anion channel family protein [Arcobacter porcinus]|uniref:Tellurite-resistance/dicarboxylate transporter (TDT) family protein n=1 Tax=Arcobacter porcinus TaxID=1935204 RepID=A0A5C2HH73_9BACT|nr:SLAC1 anion channel family protein [Arcobacter porcinus]OCL86595.1 Tellurite resistance protein TehA [Arcobacter porcinus]QEP40651.1 tellurite-resistance/dicarboxylate transporter (TDT) family protein [Arcobacter porcinus]
MQQERIKSIPSNRLQFFPIMMFAIVMGMGGLTLVFQKLSLISNFSSYFSKISLLLTTVLFSIIAISYLLKIIFYKEEVKKELKHPIRINFFAAFSISILILSASFREYDIDTSKILFYFGALFHIYFTYYTIRFWINNSLEIVHSNPAWFIPIVGNLIIPIAGVNFFNNQILIFYFSIGLFFWLVLFSIILNRIMFHQPFAAKFMPTMFILIAPPSIGFISYIKLTNSLDFFAQILFSLGLFFTILVAFMYKNFLKIRFFISWWAFTFPMAAVTLSTLLMYELTNNEIFIYLSYFLSTITTFIVVLVAFSTIKYISKKEICIME